LYTPPSSVRVDINDIVVQLGNHNGKILIPKLTSYEIDVIEDLQENEWGDLINPIPGTGSLKLKGEEVGTKRETVRLQNRIEAIEDSMTGQQSGVIVGFADTAEAACTCSANDVEAVVTTDFVRGKVDESYISSLGFTKESTLSGNDFSSDCTCTASDVQNNIDQSFLESLGVSFGASDCSCSTDFVIDVIDSNYIKGVVDGLGTAYGNVDATCTCSSQDIENVVTYDYIADKGFADNLSECSCSIQDSQITDVVDNGYIAGLGFLTTCPCGDTITLGDSFWTDDFR